MGFLRNLASVLTFGIVEDTYRAEKRKEKQKEEQKRVNTPVLFEPPITKEKFNELAIEAGKHIKRLWIETENHYVIGTVKSASGISEWLFKFDYNNYGKITGKCWLVRLGNRDSNIPNSYVKKLYSLIQQEIGNNICPNCQSAIDKQDGFDPKANYHECTKCEHMIFNPKVYSGEKFPGIYWFCDECKDLLSAQKGFKDTFGTWKCLKCNHINPIDLDPSNHNLTLDLRTIRLSNKELVYEQTRCETIKSATWNQIEEKIDEVFKHYDELHYGGRLKKKNLKAGERLFIDDLIVDLHPDSDEYPCLEFGPYSGFAYIPRNSDNIVVSDENLDCITPQYVKTIFKKFYEAMEAPNDSWWGKEKVS